MDRLEIADPTSRNKNYGDGNGAWTTALQVLLPLAVLTLLWGRQGFITRFFLQFKENYISAQHPSSGKRPHLLHWVEKRLKYTWFSQLTVLGNKTTEYWKNGSLLCSLINSAIPGACCNPQRHWNERPTHGQDLAFKYLGVAPIFNDSDFNNENLQTNREYQFFNYLMDVQKLVNKISQRKVKFTTRYVARGMGLVTGEQFKKSIFYVYNNSMITNRSDVVISISGPYGNHCTVTIPPTCVKKQADSQRLAYVSKAQKLFFRSFSIDLGSIINTDRKSADDIPIQIINEQERVKIMFIPQTAGMHEISIVTRGFHLIGSPFLANVLPHSSHLYESFDNHIEYDSCKNSYKRIKKKIISKIIDCIDEQINCYKLDTTAYDMLGKKASESTFEVGSRPVQQHLTASATNELCNSMKTGVLNSSNGNSSIQEHVYVNDTHRFKNHERGALDDKLAQLKSESNVEQQSLVNKNLISGHVVDTLRTSPICDSHIVQEVTKVNKKLLKRQEKIEIEEEISKDLDINCTEVDEKFEELLENEGYYDNAVYADSYLSELESQPELPRDKSSVFSRQEDLVHDYHQQRNDIVKEVSKPIPRIRRSLPNILLPSNIKPVSSRGYQAKFKERHDYWESLSSRTLSCSSICSDHYTSFNIFGAQKHGTKIVGSLPNLSELRESILKESNLKCDSYTDFYNDYEEDNFRRKFLQCKNYWESFSSRQNLNLSMEMISENDLDSGYYASLPNLSPDIEQGTKLSKNYKETRQFWENLSLDNSKWNQNQHKKKKHVQRAKTFPSKTFAKYDDTICEHEDEVLSKKEEGNLTDDLKQLNHIQYAQARNFFKNLEQLET